MTTRQQPKGDGDDENIEDLLKVEGTPIIVCAGVFEPQSETAIMREWSNGNNHKLIHLKGVKYDYLNVQQYFEDSTKFDCNNAIQNMKSQKTSIVKDAINDLYDEVLNGPMGVYFTGHGDHNGSWCFKDGEIEWQWFGQKIIERKGNIYLFIDCCNSGNWCINLEQLESKCKNVYIFAASLPNKKAFDNGKQGGYATKQWLKTFEYLFDDNGSLNSVIQNRKLYAQLYGCLGYIDSDKLYHFLQFKDPHKAFDQNKNNDDEQKFDPIDTQ
eukprot:489638_1